MYDLRQSGYENNYTQRTLREQQASYPDRNRGILNDTSNRSGVVEDGAHGQTYGALADELLLRKFDDSNMEPPEDLYYNYSREGITNQEPDKNVFEGGEPRRTRYGEERVNLIYYGHRGTEDDPAHPELNLEMSSGSNRNDLGILQAIDGGVDGGVALDVDNPQNNMQGGRDLRGIADAPDFARLTDQAWARGKYQRWDKDNLSEKQITSGGLNEHQISEVRRKALTIGGNRLKVFSTQRQGFNPARNTTWQHKSELDKIMTGQGADRQTTADATYNKHLLNWDAVDAELSVARGFTAQPFDAAKHYREQVIDQQLATMKYVANPAARVRASDTENSQDLVYKAISTQEQTDSAAARDRVAAALHMCGVTKLLCKIGPETSFSDAGDSTTTKNGPITRKQIFAILNGYGYQDDTYTADFGTNGTATVIKNSTYAAKLRAVQNRAQTDNFTNSATPDALNSATPAKRVAKIRHDLVKLAKSLPQSHSTHIKDSMIGKRQVATTPLSALNIMGNRRKGARDADTTAADITNSANDKLLQFAASLKDDGLSVARKAHNKTSANIEGLAANAQEGSVSHAASAANAQKIYNRVKTNLETEHLTTMNYRAGVRKSTVHAENYATSHDKKESVSTVRGKTRVDSAEVARPDRHSAQTMRLRDNMKIERHIAPMGNKGSLTRRTEREETGDEVFVMN